MRALELCPRRLYCLAQAGALHYQAGAYGEALAAYTECVTAGRLPACLPGRPFDQLSDANVPILFPCM